MTSKPSFLSKSNSIGRYFAPLFFLAHVLFGVLTFFSAPTLLVIVLGLFITIVYLIGVFVALIYFLGLVKSAIKDFIKNGLNKESREVIVFVLITTVVAIVCMKLIG
ncbi:MAG: hypothetical protein H6774_03040 [Pseudomonadales bacterium]|nr:hypothetical protein [Pseudomonadales bacterium]